MPLPTSHVFIVPSSPTSGHRTLKLVGLIQWEHAMLISAELVQHWTRLDKFEGSGYTRQLGLVWLEDSSQVASVYVTSPGWSKGLDT
jgi:hypothetical protein